MTALIVIGAIILFFAFILSLKAKITVIYDGEVALYVKVLFIKIKILPSGKKKKGPHSMSKRKAKKIKAKLEAKAEKKRLKKKQKKAEKQAKKEEEAKHPKEKKSLSEILDIIRMVKDIAAVVIKRFFKHLRIDIARLKINVATGDAATTAIAYGAISQAAMYLFTVLAPVKGFSFPETQNAEINCDYLSDNTTVDIKIFFSIRVWHVLDIAFGALGKFIRHKLMAEK